MTIQAIELLAICLAAAIFLALLLIITNCVTTCYHNCRHDRRKSSDVERLPEDYVNEIHRLLDRHKKVMNEYDYPNTDHSDGALSPVTESMVNTPIKLRSRSNSVRLQKLKEELEEFRVESPEESKVEECETKRRTWGGLNDSIFDPIEFMPNLTDAEAQTSGTLQRMSPPAVMKIETTV